MTGLPKDERSGSIRLMDTLIAFDFDGTLYPFAPYDSEELLMLLASKKRGRLMQIRAKRAVARDMAGKSPLDEFDRNFLRYAKGATGETIGEVVDYIMRPCRRENYASLESLSLRADLIVLSAGTTDISRMFLERMGVARHFKGFYGKHLCFDASGKMTGYTSEVPTTEAKANILRGFRRSYTTIFAAGDGLTDKNMLAEADLGILLRYDGKAIFPGYPITRSIPETITMMLSSL